MASTDTATFVRETIARIAGIAPPADGEDIYTAGFASTDALELLVEREDRFGVVLPDDRFLEARTIAALVELVESLPQEAAG